MIWPPTTEGWKKRFWECAGRIADLNNDKAEDSMMIDAEMKAMHAPSECADIAYRDFDEPYNARYRAILDDIGCTEAEYMAELKQRFTPDETEPLGPPDQVEDPMEMWTYIYGPEGK